MTPPAASPLASAALRRLVVLLEVSDVDAALGVARSALDVAERADAAPGRPTHDLGTAPDDHGDDDERKRAGGPVPGQEDRCQK
jgi:hypothetical protein